MADRKTEYDEGVPTTARDIAPDSPVASSEPPRRKGFGFSSSSTVPKKSASSSVTSPKGSARASSTQSGDGVRASSKADLAKAEGSSGGGGLYNDDGSSGGIGTRFKKTFSRKNLKRNSVVAGVAITLVGGGGGMYMSMVPLKIEHMVTNMRSRFFSSSENAIEGQTDKLLGRYIVKHVIPSYKKCGTTIDRACSVRIAGDGNPVTNLYKTWADVRLENKLAENYGLEIKKKGDNWFLKTGSGGDIDIGKDGEKFDDIFKNADQTEVKRAVREATQNETRWKRVYIRYKVGRLLERKYGIKRYIFFDGTRTKINASVTEKKNAAKYVVANRVLQGRTSMLDAVMECLTNPSCHPEDTDVPTEDGNGTKSDTDEKMESELEKVAGKYEVDPGEMKDAYDAMAKNGYKGFMLEKVMLKFGIKMGTKKGVQVAVNAIPYVGQVISMILAASDVINILNHAGPALKKLTYTMNAASSVQLFMTYETYANEVHTGEVDPRVVGSFNDSLGPGNKGTDEDPSKGGTAKAESTPLYQDIMNNKQSREQHITLNNLSGKASAAGGHDSVYTKSDYTCDDGKPVPEGKLVCDEEVLGRGDNVADDVHNILNMPGINYLTFAAGIIGDAQEAVGGVASDFIMAVPGVEAAADAISGLINPIIESILKDLIPDPFGTSMSGGRTFDMMAAGADVAGNDYAQNGLGGQKLTNEEVAQIRNEQLNQDEAMFANKPLFTRLFDTNNSRSLVSRVAIAIPFGKQSQVQSGVASITSPMSVIGNTFGSIFTGRVNAAIDVQDDPFGVVQYGYPAGTIPDDPEAYWDAHCTDDVVKGYKKDNSWFQAAADSEPDELTGMPVNTTTNPCMLIKATAGALGGLYDQSNLTDDDLEHVSSSETAGGSQQPDETIDMEHLYESSVDIACADGTNDVGVQDGYHDGKKVKIRVCGLKDVPETGGTSDIEGANGKLLVNSRMSAFYVNLIQDAKGAGVKNISAAEGFRTMAQQKCFASGGCGATGAAAAPGYSNHQMGVAVDWGDSMIAYLQQHSHGLKALVPGEDWHWSPSGN